MRARRGGWECCGGCPVVRWAWDFRAQMESRLAPGSGTVGAWGLRLWAGVQGCPLPATEGQGVTSGSPEAGRPVASQGCWEESSAMGT